MEFDDQNNDPDGQPTEVRQGYHEARWHSQWPDQHISGWGHWHDDHECQAGCDCGTHRDWLHPSGRVGFARRHLATLLYPVWLRRLDHALSQQWESSVLCRVYHV